MGSMDASISAWHAANQFSEASNQSSGTRPSKPQSRNQRRRSVVEALCPSVLAAPNTVCCVLIICRRIPSVFGSVYMLYAFVALVCSCVIVRALAACSSCAACSSSGVLLHAHHLVFCCMLIIWCFAADRLSSWLLASQQTSQHIQQTTDERRLTAASHRHLKWSRALLLTWRYTAAPLLPVPRDC